MERYGESELCLSQTQYKGKLSKEAEKRKLGHLVINTTRI